MKAGDKVRVRKTCPFCTGEEGIVRAVGLVEVLVEKPILFGIAYFSANELEKIVSVPVKRRKKA